MLLLRMMDSLFRERVRRARMFAWEVPADRFYHGPTRDRSGAPGGSRVSLMTVGDDGIFRTAAERGGEIEVEADPALAGFRERRVGELHEAAAEDLAILQRLHHVGDFQSFGVTPATVAGVILSVL
jgi:hypothetical protein